MCQRSRTESTRRQALEVVIDLAWEGKHVSNLLEEMDVAQTIKAQESYIWDFCDKSLLLSSRMVLACIGKEKFLNVSSGYAYASFGCRHGEKTVKLSRYSEITF